MGLSPFVLYGLMGCPHCSDAETYLKKAGVPYLINVANEDPIADEGIKKLTGKDAAEYPVLLYKLTKQIVVGYKPEEYEHLVRAFFTFVGSSTPNTFGGQQPDIPQATQQVKVA
jgi:glutaredoxin